MMDCRYFGGTEMKRDDLWKAYTDRNPSFEGSSTVTMTPAGLRKLFEQTWEKAHEAGFANGKAWAALHAPKDDSLFGNIFGKR
jgi:hypothetical protein